MQSVWGAFFSDVERISKIETPEHLMKHLAKVAGNKLIDRDRKFRAQRHDINRECDLPRTEMSGQVALVGNDPTPSKQVAADDEWDVKTQGLTENERTVLELRRKGHTSDEIAEITSFSARKVRRMLEKLRQLFNRGEENQAAAARQHKTMNGSSRGTGTS